ncbi:MAG: hypothetical protein CL540_14410, partial [Alcanivorax sp.]|nr:hypothetical protein [Alcanivorax sp.]
MTPAVKAAEKAGVDFQLHAYEHDPQAESYGREAAECLGLAPERVFKTLLAEVDGKVQVAMVPVDHSLDLKALARAAGGKKAAMVDGPRAERLTGYVLGGISPLGQKKGSSRFGGKSRSSRSATQGATPFRERRKYVPV